MIILTIGLNLVATAAHAFLAVQFISGPHVVREMRGDARLKKDGSFAYSERHTLTLKDGRLHAIATEYRAGGTGTVAGGTGTVAGGTGTVAEGTGPVFATMKHEFAEPGFLPDYSYEDARNKVEHRLTVDRKTKQLLLSRRADGNEKTKTLDLKNDMAAGQGVYFWLVANIDELARGQKVYTKFVVPALLDQFSFHAQRVKIEGDRLTINVALDNWFFRLFASRIEFDIDMKSKALIEYRGTSNVADAFGKYQDVVIKYDQR